MAITPEIIAGVEGLAGTASAVSNLVGGGSSTPQSGGTPQTATGGQSANILPAGSLQSAGLQYLNDASGLQGYGQNYVSQFFPQVMNATQSAANNSYASGALSNAQTASDYGMNTLAGQQQQGASALSGLASQYGPYIQSLLSQSQQRTPGAAYENQYLQQAATPIQGMQYAGQALNQAFSPTLGGQYAAQALATGFSPNNGLYNQQLQQTQDQSNAINAMYGLGSSPYGAGLTDEATQKFNNAFNLNQANLQSQAANTYSNLMNQQLGTQQQGFNQYTGLLNQNLANQTGNLNAYNSLAATDLNQVLGYGGLANTFGNTAGSLAGLASSLGQGAYNTYANAGQLPAQTYQGLANNSLSAYGIGAQNANATLNPYTTYLNSLGNILGLGQIGQSNAAQQAQTGFNQSQTVGSNLGQSLAQLGGTGTGSIQSLWNALSGIGGGSDPTAGLNDYLNNWDASFTVVG